MRIDEVIKIRRSVYPNQFNGKKVEDAYIDHLLELASWAPTHYLTQPWRFRIYTGESLNNLMDQMKALYKKHTPPEKFRNSKIDKYELRKTQVSHVIAISVKYDEKERLPQIEEVCAVASAVQNLWLAMSESPDVRGYWSTGQLVFTQEFADFVGLEEGEENLGIFYLGRVDQDCVVPPQSRSDLDYFRSWVR